MLKVKLTKNYAGVNITGEYDDLDQLYDAISSLIHDEPLNIGETTMSNHLFSFLYELRHAYQGQREAFIDNNGMNDNVREWNNIKKNDVTDNNLYFSFNYVVTDILLDMLLIKYYIDKVNKKDNNVYNTYINLVNYFYSLVLNSFLEILTPIKFNKIKKSLIESLMTDRIFYPQWFQIISCDYVSYSKEKRLKMFTSIADEIINYHFYDEYLKMKKRMLEICEKDKCTLDDFFYHDYPEDLDW